MRLTLALLLFLLLSCAAHAQLPLPLALFSNSYVAGYSPYNWTVPSGVVSVLVDATGAGSGSAGVGYGGSCLVIGNPGQNGDFVRDYTIAVVPGHVLQIIVGAGGVGGMAPAGAGCYNGAGGPYLGQPGGATKIIDTTTGQVLLNLAGGQVFVVPPPEAMCSVAGCNAYYAVSAGMQGWAANAGSPQALGGYYMPISQFGIGADHDPSWGSPGAVFFSGACLGAQPGIMYGQGASSSVSINSPGPCGGNTGGNGFVRIKY